MTDTTEKPISNTQLIHLLGQIVAEELHFIKLTNNTEESANLSVLGQTYIIEANEYQWYGLDHERQLTDIFESLNDSGKLVLHMRIVNKFLARILDNESAMVQCYEMAVQQLIVFYHHLEENKAIYTEDFESGVDESILRKIISENRWLMVYILLSLIPSNMVYDIIQGRAYRVSGSYEKE